jgi:hypothetical protein
MVPAKRFLVSRPRLTLTLRRGLHGTSGRVPAPTHGRQAIFRPRISKDNQTPQSLEDRTGLSPIGAPLCCSGRKTPYSTKSLAPDRPTQVDAIAAGYRASKGTCGPADRCASQRVGARYSLNRCTPACTDEATRSSPIARAIATGGQTKGQGSQHQAGRHYPSHRNSPSLSGEMSGFNGRQMDPCT